MITAFETTDTIRQALRLRACDYINKPFDIATIRAAVEPGDAAPHAGRRNPQQRGKSPASCSPNCRTSASRSRSPRRAATFTRSIIHDINGPLTVISGFVQLLNQKLNRTSQLEVEDLEFIKERLRIIDAAGGQLHRDFPALPRISAPAKPTNRSARGVNQLLQRPGAARARASQPAGK